MTFLLQDEVALIGVIYKTHRSLPPKSPAKISSLYVLDSIARGVQKMYRNNKEKDPRTATIAKGFLTKVEGVLEDWTRDMCDGWPEGQVSIHILSFVQFRHNTNYACLCVFTFVQEKTAKILDIWVKAQTFSASLLTRLQDIASQTNGKSPQDSQARSTTPDHSPPPSLRKSPQRPAGVAASLTTGKYVSFFPLCFSCLDRMRPLATLPGVLLVTSRLPRCFKWNV